MTEKTYAYYCLNIKHAYYDKNSKSKSEHEDASDHGAASYWLGRDPNQRGRAVIFFGDKTVCQIRTSKQENSANAGNPESAKKDNLRSARDFIDIGDNKRGWNSVRIVTVQDRRASR